MMTLLCLTLGLISLGLILTLTAKPVGQEIALRRMERKLDALLKHHGVPPPSKLSPEVQELLRNPGQQIAAIKRHREQTGVGLAEAKADIEEFLRPQR